MKISVTLFSGTVKPTEVYTCEQRLDVLCIPESNQLLLLICPFISSFFFLSNFQTLKSISHSKVCVGHLYSSLRVQSHVLYLWKPVLRLGCNTIESAQSLIYEINSNLCGFRPQIVSEL